MVRRENYQYNGPLYSSQYYEILILQTIGYMISRVMPKLSVPGIVVLRSFLFQVEAFIESAFLPFTASELLMLLRSVSFVHFFETKIME